MFNTKIEKTECFGDFPIVGPNLLKDIEAVGFRKWNGDICSVYLGSLEHVFQTYFSVTSQLIDKNPMSPIDKGELSCIGFVKDKDRLEPICNFGLQYDEKWYILVERI